MSEPIDQKSADQIKKEKSSATMHALLIGCAIGVIIWGVAKNNFGFFALIPLFFAYRYFTGSKKKNQE